MTPSLWSLLSHKALINFLTMLIWGEDLRGELDNTDMQYGKKSPRAPPIAVENIINPYAIVSDLRQGSSIHPQIKNFGFSLQPSQISYIAT